jgi:hypothetical protein
MINFNVSSSVLIVFGFLTPLGLSSAFPFSAAAGGEHNHGGGLQEDLKSGEFRSMPVITLEGHGGFENNLEGKPAHYAIDGLFGAVMEWGLPNQGSFAIEATFGPALVWGEAEHFYGRVEVEEDHGGLTEEGHGDEEHAHEEGAPYRRIDMKGMLQARYQPSDRLSLSATWLPYYVTKTQGEDEQGVKHQVEAAVTYAFGDGDVNFALGDGLESVMDGVFVSVRNRTGWETDGTYLGNYTDAWAGFGFNVDRLNVTVSGGPRFYVPGSYSGLSQRTDWGGDISVEYPISDQVVAFAHFEAIYSTDDGEGWGKGFQNHVGTGLTFRF